MKITNDNYVFRSVAPGDLQLLSTWLKEPVVSRWYDDPDYIEDLEEHLDDARIRMQLVVFNDEPIAFVQDYDIHAWEDHHLAFLPVGSRGIDTFIGSAALSGKGHGTNYLALLCMQLFDVGVPALGIDPHPDNHTARHVYQNIGFIEDDEVESQWGHVVLMSRFAPQVHQALGFPGDA